MKLKRSERLQRLWPLGLTLCLALGGQLVMTLFMLGFGEVVQHSNWWQTFATQSPPWMVVLIWLGFYVGTFALVIYGVKQGLACGWGSLTPVLGFRWRDLIRFKHICLALFACATFATVVVPLAEMIASGTWGSPLLDATSRWPFSSQKEYQAGTIVLIVLAGPLYEECLFRGFMLPAFQHRFGSAVALVSTSLLFAAGHAYSATGTIEALIAGGMLGWIRIRTGCLAASLLTHVMLNALFVVISSFWTLW